MRFSSTGRALLGQGGTRVSVDGKMLFDAPAGGWAWVNANVVAGQASAPAGSDYELYAYRLDIDEMRPLETPSQGGANFFEAGGNVWAAWLGGLRTSSSLSLPYAGIKSVSEYGDIVIAEAYQNPVTMVVYSIDSPTPIRVSVGLLWGACARGNVMTEGAILYSDNGLLRGFNAPHPVALPSIDARFCQSPKGKRYIYHNAPNGLVLYPWVTTPGPVMGWVLSTDGQDFNPDAWCPDEDTVIVGSSRTQAEGPGDLRKYAIDVTRPMVNLQAQSIPPVKIDKFNHVFYLAPFKAVNDRADYGVTQPPTNAIMLDTADFSKIQPPLATIGEGPDADIVPDLWLKTYYGSAESATRFIDPGPDRDAFESGLRSQKDRAIKRKRPLVLNMDGSAPWPDAQWFIDRYCQPEPGLEIVPAMELYPIKGATVDAIVAEWRRQLTFMQAKFGRLACAVSFYTQSKNFDLALIVQLSPLAADLVREFKPIVVSPFSMGRDSGILTNYDVLWPLLLQWQAAIPSGPFPALLSLGDNKVTGSVTISSWGPTSGIAPLVVNMIGQATGDVAQYLWRYRNHGSDTWVTMNTTPLTNPTYSAIFRTPGQYDIGVVGLDASGKPIPGAETGTIRMVTVGAVVVAPPPATPAVDLPQALAALAAAEANLATVRKLIGG